MKILIISPKFHPVIGGGETFVLNSIQHLHDNGFDVSIAVEPRADRNINDYDFPVYEIEGMSDNQLDVIKAPSGLHDLLQLLNPDIIHAHGYFALLATQLVNIGDTPLVASIHSTPVWGERLIGGMDSFEAELHFARNIVKATRPRVLTAANDVYADAALKVVDGCAEVRVLPYPVDTNLFAQPKQSDLRSKMGLTNGDTLIIVPSRIIPRKGIHEAVQALALLPKNFYICLPAAVNPLDPEFWSQVKATDAYKQVASRVFVPDEPVLYADMPVLYGACDVVAMPSYYEGAPVATVEAMASGKPFVGADSQGINGFIKDGINGLLVPQKDPTALARAIQSVIANPEAADLRAQQAQKDVAYLSWEEQIKNLTQLYDSVVQPAQHVENQASRQ